MSQPLTIIIVEKGGSLKTLAVKDYKVEELYKKCGFKKAEGFDLQVEWPVKIDTKRYIIQMYGKTDGKANSENKYDFPPPVDNKLYFGSCALIGMMKDDANNATIHINLTVELWEKMYEKLFGGFENLALTCNDDEDEEDELQNVSKNRKTKRGGYLKDGFVVDSSDSEEVSGVDSCEEENSEEPTENSGEAEEDEEEFVLDDTKSELSEESYIEEDNQS